MVKYWGGQLWLEKRTITTHMGVVHVVDRVIDIRRSGRLLLAIAERVVGACDPAKVNGKIASSADDAPVIVARDQNLALADMAAGKLQVGAMAVGRDETLLAQGGSHRAEGEPEGSLHARREHLGSGGGQPELLTTLS